MPKYLLLKHYTGGPAAPLPNYAPMDEWTPEEITAHMAFQHEVTRMLTERGEFVDAQALSPQAPGCSTAVRRPHRSSPTGPSRRPRS